jgi:aerobic carbon-monoxide dehydrogenase medium subunit
VKPPPFKHFSAHSTDEAVSLLAEHGDDAKVLAGGQSLVPLLNMRLARPECLVDITRIAELGGAAPVNGQLELRAAVRQADAEDSSAVETGVPLLHEALEHVAHREIRNAGTVCGSAAHADSAAEIPAVCLALDAEMVAASSRGTRVIAARDFYVSYLETALDPDELLTAIRLPVQAPGTGASFLEVAPRRGDYALAGVALSLTTANDVVRSASLAFLGVGPTPVRADAAEQLLRDATPSDALLSEAAWRASEELDPADDVHASADYRREAARVLARRALGIALDRARMSQNGGAP